MAGSVFIGFFIKLFAAVNAWYEASLTHRAIKKLSVYCVNSFIIGHIIRYIAGEGRRWAAGSVAVDAARRLNAAVWRTARTAYRKLRPSFEGSFILKIFTLDAYILAVFRPEIALSLFFVCASIIPADYWNNMFITAAALLFFILYAANVVRDKARVRTALPAALIVYFVIIIINLSGSSAFSDSLRVAAVFFSCAAAGLLVTNILDDEKKLDIFLGAVFAGVFLSALLGFYQYIRGIEVRADLTDLINNPGLRRVFSSMGNPNNYAEYLILFLPFCVSYALNRKNAYIKFIAVCMLAPMFLSLVLTSSRAAYLAAVFSAALFVLLVNKRLVPFLAVAAALAVPFIPASIAGRVMTIGTDSSSKYRMMIWEASLKVLRDSWVSGVSLGPRAFSRVYRIYSNDRALNAMHAHNLFLQIWIENGIFGITAFLAFLFTTLKKLLESAFTAPKKNKGYLAAALCSLTGFMIFGAVEYTWFYPRVTLSFWIAVGLSLRLIAMNVKTDVKDTAPFGDS